MSAATESIKKQMKGWGAAYYITEFLPLTAGIITAMVYNPSIWQWLIFIFLGISIVGGIILAVRHSWKTLVWGLMLVLCLGLNGWVMYTIIGGCFTFAAVNDLWLQPKYTRLRDKYRQFSNQDEYQKLNEVK